LATLGLWGDGDEVFAIEDAFRAIGVELPVEDAPNWITVGDLWNSVERVSPDVAARPSAWDEFRRALSEESCVAWTDIQRSTTLLDGRGHSIIQRLFFALRERLGMLHV
jgi:hypothetical protein